MVKRIILVMASMLTLSFSFMALGANLLVEKTMTDACAPDANTVVNPTAQTITALGVADAAACVAAAGWASGTNFTNGYRSVRLGKQNRECDSELNVQSTAALQPGSGKITAWTCNGTPCSGGDGKQYLRCTGTSN